MGYEQRVSFQESFRSSLIDHGSGRPESIVWHHSLMIGGSVSVQHRLTGWGMGSVVWDQETAYSSPCGQFWLAAGGWDIRNHLAEFDSEEGMIEWVMNRANLCEGGHFKNPGVTLKQLLQSDNWSTGRVA